MLNKYCHMAESRSAWELENAETGREPLGRKATESKNRLRPLGLEARKRRIGRGMLGLEAIESKNRPRDARPGSWKTQKQAESRSAWWLENAETGRGYLAGIPENTGTGREPLGLEAGKHRKRPRGARPSS